MATLEKITEPGALDLFAWVKTDASALLDRTTLSSGFQLIYPNGSRSQVPVVGVEPETGSTTRVKVQLNQDFSAKSDWPQGVYKIVALDSILTLAGDPVKPETELATVRVEIVNGDRPVAKPVTIPSLITNASSHEFTVTFEGARSLELASINQDTLLVTGPGSFSKSPSVTSKNSSGNQATVVFSLAGPFAAANAGVYTVHLLAGGISDTNAWQCIEAIVGKFSVALGDVAGSTATETNLKGLSTLPTGWLAGADAPEFSAEGIKIKKQTNFNYVGSYLRSPQFTLADGADVQIDYMGESLESQSGFSGEYAEFSLADPHAWHGDDLRVAPGETKTPKQMRARFRRTGRDLLITFYHKLGSGYVQVNEVTKKLNEILPDDCVLYIDAPFEDLVVNSARL